MAGLHVDPQEEVLSLGDLLGQRFLFPLVGVQPGDMVYLLGFTDRKATIDRTVKAIARDLSLEQMIDFKSKNWGEGLFWASPTRDDEVFLKGGLWMCFC